MMRAGSVVALLCMVMPMVPAMGASLHQSTFGKQSDGHTVQAVTLSNDQGVSVRVITYGARVQSIVTPDRDGKRADIVLGYKNMKGYLAKRQYFGATVGRYANRIAKGRFTLNGKRYQLTINDGPNSLHGGKKGFDMQLWKIVKTRHGKNAASVTMRYISPDGDQGYPGRLTTDVTYTLGDDNRLTIDERATTDKPTIVNLSNHTYWNLGGEGSGTVMNERLMIAGASITPVDKTQIPTGEIRSVAGTPFDFRHAKPIGQDIRDGHSRQLVLGHGYDINWVISRKASARPRLVARVTDPDSGRVLSLYSRKPGLQFYSGNFLDGTTVGKSGHIYRQGDAFVLEPQLFPDTPNHPSFGSAELKPGQTYENRIVYRFSVDKEHAQ